MRIPLTPARDLGARPELFGPLRADVTDYGNPGVRLGPPRARRRGPGVPGAPSVEPPDAPLAPPGPPRVRLWSFALQETAPGDAIASSPFINGPALLETLMLHWNDDNTTPRPTIGVFYGEVQPASTFDDPSTLTQLGTGIFETPTFVQQVVGSWQGGIQHLPKWHGGAVSDPTQYWLRYPIALPRFQISVRMGTQTAGSHIVSGYLRVLEGESLEALAPYL